MADKKLFEVINDIGLEKTADLLEKMGSLIMEVSDNLEDEGDRVYLGTTNHRDQLQVMVDEWFQLRWLNDREKEVIDELLSP